MKKIIIAFLLITITFLIFFIWKKNFWETKNYTILPSDKNIFTQWIFVDNGKIFMSSGAPNNFKNTKSVVGILNENGVFEQKFELDKNIFFGEWITKLKNKIYFVTWKNQKSFLLDAENFEKIGEFSYQNQEWWGVTSDDEKIFMSDGTEKITIFDENFEKISDFIVSENGKPINKINELEYINGFIFANIWLTNDIIKINTKNGIVEKRWNFDFLKNEELQQNPNAQEMNGIAYDKTKKTIILTGKMWKNLYIFDEKFFQ